MSPESLQKPAQKPERTFPVRVEHVRCVCCGRDEPNPYRSRMYRVQSTRFDLVRCPCGLVYIDPRPDGATLEALYDDPDYYTDGYNLGVQTENYFTRKDELIAQAQATVAEYEREIGTTKGDLLELGSAGGFFLEGARRRGWRVHGVELSPPAAEYSIREMKLDVHRGLLESASFEERSFDLVLADNVLEHTTEPSEVLAQLFRLLRPGGHLIVIVPAYVNSPWFRAMNAARKWLPRRFLGAQLLKILKFDAEDAGYPYHILEFDRATLRGLVERTGFVITKDEGSVPLPGHLFGARSPDLKTRLLRTLFSSMDTLMRLRVLPPARVRLVARRPR